MFGNDLLFMNEGARTTFQKLEKYCASASSKSSLSELTKLDAIITDVVDSFDLLIISSKMFDKALQSCREIKMGSRRFMKTRRVARYRKKDLVK